MKQEFKKELKRKIQLKHQNEKQKRWEQDKNIIETGILCENIDK